MSRHWIPEGWPRVTPRLFVEDVPACVAFLKHVFAAAGEVPDDRPTVLEIGESKIMVSASGPREANPSCLYVYVPDVDDAYRRALSSGASVLEEPADLPWGDRRAIVRDPWGNDWQIASQEHSS